jgi:putative component of toxin-antitoxin plasmid stabilization module
MSEFKLKKYKPVKGGRENFYLLFKDEVCEYETFCEQIEADGNLKSELLTAIALMNMVARGVSLSKTKFREVKGSKDKVKEYEIKTRNLRVYLFKDDKGKVIVAGGNKSSQKKDIRKFQSLKKQYLDSL